MAESKKHEPNDAQRQLITNLKEPHGSETSAVAHDFEWMDSGSLRCLRGQQQPGGQTIDLAIREAMVEKQRPSLIAVLTHIGYGSPLHDTPKVRGEPLGPENARATKQNLGWRPLTTHCQHREHTELVSPLFNEGAQMLPQGDQSWRLSPLFNEDDQDAQIN